MLSVVSPHDPPGSPCLKAHPLRRSPAPDVAAVIPVPLRDPGGIPPASRARTPPTTPGCENVQRSRPSGGQIDNPSERFADFVGQPCSIFSVIVPPPPRHKPLYFIFYRSRMKGRGASPCPCRTHG